MAYKILAHNKTNNSFKISFEIDGKTIVRNINKIMNEAEYDKPATILAIEAMEQSIKRKLELGLF